MDEISGSAFPTASLSRNLHNETSTPTLIHSLVEQKSSVLSLAATQLYIFSGSQNQDILVWNKGTFTLKRTLSGHEGSVLALEYAPEKEWLFSSSGDSTVRVWSTHTLKPLFVLKPYLEDGAGDIFSLAWLPSTQTIFIGCQNTSLQWFSFDNDSIQGSESTGSSSGCTPGPSSGASTPSGIISLRQAHRFFDSYPRFERKPADLLAKNNSSNRIPGRGSPDSGSSDDLPATLHLQIPSDNVRDPAHFGYIYCMTLLTTTGDGITRLATGSGDEGIKLWRCLPSGPEFEHEFIFDRGAVLSIVARGDTIYAGCQDGYVKVVDLETKTLIRTIIVEEGVDIISISLLSSDLFTCTANGWIKRWSASFDCIASWKAHSGIALSSIVTQRGQGFYLVTGGNDSSIKIWDILPSSRTVGQELQSSPLLSPTATDVLAYALSKLVSIPSVSSDPSHKEDCRQTASWLRKCLGQLGARTSLLPTGEGINPLVLATFNGTLGEYRKPRVLFYGHYDVIPAPSNGWNSAPFTMTGRNGYLYGRGVTDNKGPILAVACAAADMLSRRALGLDLVMLIEGEEECGSIGFGEAVRKHKAEIGDIDAILVSNSTWISDDRPCITYGLRGVVHCNIEISSQLPDLHSGIEGGGVIEPMADMVKLLALLTDNRNKILIPGFYDAVRPETTQEKELYDLLAEITHKTALSLAARWREPSLTIHTIGISGPQNATVIPSSVKAQVSLRIVPDQDLQTIIAVLNSYIAATYQTFNSPNKIQVAVDHSADWWLGRLDDPWFKALESAVHEEWGEEPLRIREGGSIPSVPWLEKEFGCHALHLPMGQSTDQAHLPNERISLINLNKGKSVVERFLASIAGAEFLSQIRSNPRT